MHINEASESLQNQRIMSFFSFLSENYELSRFVLPKKRPLDDTLLVDEMQRLKELMMDKDFYEINTIIRKRYEVKEV
jgi:hypothetical protein